MEILNNQLIIENFFLSLSSVQTPLLLLDYDGTLSPFTTDRNQAFPYEGIIPCLNKIINRTRTQTVIITGRSIDDLLKLLPLETLPEIWGAHGFERMLPTGQRFTTPLTNKITDALSRYEKALIDNDLMKYCEIKPAGFAVHWRGRDEHEINSIRQKVFRISNAHTHQGLKIHHFDGGLELRHSGIDKGTAVNTILSEQQKSFSAAYLGDDLTDEDAFNKMGSRGLKVLVRQKTRKTSADLRLTPPEDLIWFLEKWLKTVYQETG